MPDSNMPTCASATNFILSAFPEFRVRHDSGQADPERWVHVGDDECYVAMYLASMAVESGHKPYSGAPGFNHLGFVVDDTEALRQRLLAAGYPESTLGNQHPARRRVYFYDAEGNDWEFVQYLSEDRAWRNDYLE
jgi:catechol 2,3-dioxygenase-like lactoylglutathione lyase family enzyme